MTELDTMYRVMILYMLNLVEYPLTNTQITNFVLEKEYTNYFTVQEAITSLLQTDLITAESTHNNTRYHLTDYGRQTLLKSEIPRRLRLHRMAEILTIMHNADIPCMMRDSQDGLIR